MQQRDALGIARALRRLLLTGLIVISVLALIAEGLTIVVLARTINDLARVLAHY